MIGRYQDPLLGIDIPLCPGMIIPLFRNCVIEIEGGQSYQVTDGDTIIIQGVQGVEARNSYSRVRRICRSQT